MIASTFLCSIASHTQLDSWIAVRDAGGLSLDCQTNVLRISHTQRRWHTSFSRTVQIHGHLQFRPTIIVLIEAMPFHRIPCDSHFILSDERQCQSRPPLDFPTRRNLAEIGLWRCSSLLRNFGSKVGSNKKVFLGPKRLVSCARSTKV